jgi:hypothetical protein
MIKFYYNGIKASDTDNKLQKAWYSNGPLNGYPEGTLTIYAREYTGFSAEVNEQFTVENDSDHYTDYFDKDKIRVKPDHPMHAQVLAAYNDQQAKREAQTVRLDAKRAARRAALQDA